MVDLIITVEDTVTVVTIEEDTEVKVVDMASIMVDFADEGEVELAILVVAADAAWVEEGVPGETPEYSDIQPIVQPERKLRNFNHVNLLLQHQCANC